jgi:uncharacterized protein YkwD
MRYPLGRVLAACGIGAGFLLAVAYIHSSSLRPGLDHDRLWISINRWRAEKGLPEYIQSARLCDIAERRLREVRRTFDHGGFSAQRFCSNDETCKLAENLAKGYASELDVIRGWESSPAHAANLVQPFRYSCLATDGTYVVHIFGDFGP